MKQSAIKPLSEWLSTGPVKGSVQRGSHIIKDYKPGLQVTQNGSDKAVNIHWSCG